MSIQLGRLISHILSDHFGDIVEKVGSDLYRFGPKSIPSITMTSKVSRPQVKKCLRALVKYGFVKFEASKNGTVAEYSFRKENALALLQYPKYILHVKNRYGPEAEAIVEELLQEGSLGGSQIVYNVAVKTKEGKERSASVLALKNTLVSLITAGYVCGMPAFAPGSEESPVPIFSLETKVNALPEIDVRHLMMKLDEDVAPAVKDDSFWTVNFDRFHQDFRDELLITAMTRSIDECGGELMRSLLQIMYQNNDPWVSVSNHIPFVEIKDFCKKSSENTLLTQYLDQYLRIIEESSNGIVTCTNSASGGQYVLKLAKASELLVWDLLYSTVQERLGTKAARIFRLIKSKKYIEEEDIQRIAMLPAKEAKQLTYKLLEEHFIEIQALRKATSGSAGPSKAFYLYYIDLNNVANMLLETIYKALYNVISRREYERNLNKRMIDKQQRVDTIVHSMRLRGEPEENIQDIEETVTPPEKLALERITLMIKKLSCAEINLCESMFILQSFFFYKNKC